MTKLNAEQRRALKLLAESAEGWTETLLLAYGFSADLLAALVETGLAAKRAERALAGRRPTEVNRIQITDAGRAALAERR